YKAGDGKAAVKLAGGIKAANARHVALLELARAQAEAQDKAAGATLAKATKLAGELTEAAAKHARHRGTAEVQMLLGDAKAALATARRAEVVVSRGRFRSAGGTAQVGRHRAAVAPMLAAEASESVRL